MGFLVIDDKARQKSFASKRLPGGLSIQTLHLHECKVCPLAKQEGLCNPNMPADGSSHPDVYILGEAPGKNEDVEGRPFVGKAGRTLRRFIPEEWGKRIRFNNTVRTRPPENRDPTRVEMEACRPSIERDIVATKPLAIFGMGATPLQWAIAQGRIGLWRGRRLPIDVAGHKVWFYPMYHPQFVNYENDEMRRPMRSTDEYQSPIEFVFAHDLQRAFAEVSGDMEWPDIHTADFALANIECVTDPDRAIHLIREMYDEDDVGIDYETNALRPYADGAKLLTASLSGKRYTFAFPIDHSQNRWSARDRQRVLDEYEDWLYRFKGRKIAHHLSFEMEWSAEWFGTDVLYAGDWDDSEGQAYILDERRGGHSLDFLCLLNFGLHLKDITGNLDRVNLDKAQLSQVLLYNGLDARYHRRLGRHQRRKLEDARLMGVYNHQLRRVPAAVLMQRKGVPIDAKRNGELLKEYGGQLEEIEKKLVEVPEIKEFGKRKGYAYRPSATQDTTFLCRQILRADVESVDEVALSAVKHPAVKLTLKWRSANKLYGTYIEPCRALVYRDGMLHPILGLTSTRTWRTSSEDPNIQNFPKREKIAKKVRRQVAAMPGYKVVSFDFAGIQARNVAMESLDKKLIDAFWHDYDIHTDWRERIQRKYPKWIPKDERNDKDALKGYRHRAKNEFVFPTFFGAQPYSKAQSLGVPEAIVEELHEEFFDEFPDIGGWHDRLFEKYYQTGYVTGLSGFRRRAPVSENQIINSPIQADESRIVLDAMARLCEMGDERLWPMLEIHDDLTFLWQDEDIDKLADIVFDTMLNCPYKWAQVVPIGVEMSVGQDWASLEEVAAHSSNKWKGRTQYKADWRKAA